MKNGSRKYTLLLSLIATIMLLSIAEPALAHPGHGSNFLPNLTEKILTPEITITGLSLAFIFGAVHALTPGHGKTLVTAYLVGSKATPLQAIFLSMVTTLTHTITIFILGFLVLFASQYVLPEQLYLVLSLLSGITICTIGCWRLESYFNDSEPHHHHHLDTETTSNSPIALGVAGGLIPCSEALILLLGAVAIHQAMYGILLVSAFSLGLALVLAIVGLIAVYCRQWLEVLPQSKFLQTYMPLVSAIVIAIFGLILTTEAII